MMDTTLTPQFVEGIGDMPQDGQKLLTWDDLYDWQIVRWDKYTDYSTDKTKTGWTDGVDEVLWSKSKPKKWWYLKNPISQRSGESGLLLDAYNRVVGELQHCKQTLRTLLQEIGG